MSSPFGEGLEGGSNEDVEADASTQSAKARLEEDGDDEEVEYGDYMGSESLNEHLTAEDEDILPDGAQEDEEGSKADQLADEDFPQLEREEYLPIDDTDPDAGPAAPNATSPLASPRGSPSIPDDTPSLQGSMTSSPGPGASPSARKGVSRTPSGALQPFERRFEARLSASPSGTPRAQSPAFLTPHSRQISISSQFSGVSPEAGESGGETPQAPWDVIRWTKLRKISSQAFSEAGKRNFGRPTCIAVSALIAIGTSKGLVLGFDYHQTLKIIIGQGTKATECGSVTALAIAADYSTIASGHANGFVFTWEVSRPARPFLQIPSLDRSVLQNAQHPDGHLANSAILHIDFLGTRHTALVSADSAGMAFSHLASRGLGPVTRAVKTTRLLGRYPPTGIQAEQPRKPSSVLAFSPLPLGNVEQATDGMGLTALLTPYLLVIVSTTPIAQTQHKSPRPKELSPHSTLSGCLAWFPAVRLKNTSADADKGTSDVKLAYCWSNVLTVLDVKVLENEISADPQKPPSLEFEPRSRWRAEEAIVAVQWLGRSVLGVLTISQRLLIIEDGSLQVTDSIDLLHKHIYHQDPFSHQLHAVVEQLNTADPSLHGVVADAFYMSFKVYKGRTFLLGFNDLTLGTLSNWADRLMALMEAGDHIAAIRLATEYYQGAANNLTIGLPTSESARHNMVRERILAMISASLNYTFSQHDEQRGSRLRELAEVCFEACVSMKETETLFTDTFEWFQEAEEESVFISILEPYVLDGEIQVLPPEVVKAMVARFISENQAGRLEELLCRLDPHSFDLDEITILCQQHMLYDALIYIWTSAIRDYVTPLIHLLSPVKMLLAGNEDENLAENPFYNSATKVFPFLAYSLTGRRYPNGDLVDEHEADQAKADLYGYLFSGTPTPWPQESQKVFQTHDDSDDEPAFPYLTLLLQFDAASFLSMVNEAFEDAFLNEDEDDSGSKGGALLNGTASRQSYKKGRQQIIEIMLDVMRQGDFEPEQVVYLDMFVARSLPKYPGQLILSGTLLNSILQRLCRPPSEVVRDDCQLSVEYLLSAYHPPNIPGLIEALRAAGFHRVLKSVYRGERMFTELLETYFEDPGDVANVFDCIAMCLRASTGSKQADSVKQSISRHIQELVEIDTVLTAKTLAQCTPDLLQSSVDALSDSHQQFVFLRALLEPDLLRDQPLSTSPLPLEQQSAFTEQYVQLMCRHDPTHVADFIRLSPTGDLRLEKVLPAMESSGVIDAAVALLSRDGLARDAMDRLVTHMQNLQHALSGLIETAASRPDVTPSQETSDDLVEDLEKYTEVGIWLCQGQSANAQRKPRPRSNPVWEVDEEDLDLDEYLWLNMIDVVVQVTQSTLAALSYLDNHPSEHAHNAFDSNKLSSSLRANVQRAFTALMATTATSNANAAQRTPGPPRQPTDHMSFLRILRAFLTRASQSAPSLADLRAALSSIFSAYTFEQGMLSLSTALLGSDVFAEMQACNDLRQRGWRPRTQACEACKRRAWGPGTGEAVWTGFVARELGRDAGRRRKLLEQSGGELARRLERGKARASSSSATAKSLAAGEREGGGEEASSAAAAAAEEETGRLTLVVFACRHIFHRACLDEGGLNKREGREAGGGGGGERERYRCPVCVAEEEEKE